MKNKHIHRAESALQGQANQMIDDLAGLIAIDTSFPPGAGYGDFASHVIDLVSPLGFACECVDVPEDLWRSQSSYGVRTNVIARRNNGAPTHCIYFHVDAVPPGDGWTVPPLELTRQSEKLFGRGTADMKGTIASTLAAIRALDDSGSEFAFNPVLLFCTDEEGGLYPGIRYLAESDKIDGPILCLNGQAQPRVWAGCFGSLDMRLRFVGRAAHSGDPGNGVNAIEEALPILVELKTLKAEIEKRVSSLPPPPTWAGGPLHARLTMTMAKGGAKGSSLPGLFEVNLNRRYLPDENSDEVIEEIRKTVGDAVATSQLVDWSSDVEGHLAPVTEPDGDLLWPRWVAALSGGFGWPVDDFKAWGSSTSSDMGWAQQTGHKEILLGGLSRPDRNVHGADEHTTTDDLMGLARSIMLYLAKDFTQTAELKNLKN